eukprot:snap_masked-scaffold_3-processed-gene-21.16-mRNA-1 protein AED:0.22 eAED:0.22 QI:0/-1/0/1/-1/1/1/0/139
MKRILQKQRIVRNLSSRRRNKNSILKPSQVEVQAPPPPTQAPENAWIEVVHPETKQTYWWNQTTNETTALGAPKPTTATLNNQQNTVLPRQGGFGQTIKEGFAFGAGAGLAREAVGGLFGMFGSGSSGGNSGNDDDGWV